MRNILILLLSAFIFGFTFSVSASDEIPKNLREFNMYLRKIPLADRVATYSQIVENIDNLIYEANTSKNLTKTQKRRLLFQYNTFRRKAKAELRKEENKIKNNIDIGKILQRKEQTTNSGILSLNNEQNNQNQTLEISPSNIGNQNGTQTPSSSTQINAKSESNSNSGVVTNPIPETKASKVTINPPVSALPSNRTISTMGWKYNIGGFSFQTGNDIITAKKLVFKNIGTAKLSDIIKSRTDIYIGNNNGGCIHLVQDNLLVLDDCGIGFNPSVRVSQDNYISIIASSIEPYFDKTIQLSFVPEESVIISGMSEISVSDIVNNANFPVYTIQPMDIFAYMSDITPNSYKIKFSNPNEMDLIIKDLKINFYVSPYSPLPLTGTYCIRPLGSNSPCIQQYDLGTPQKITLPISGENNTIGKKTNTDGVLEYELLFSGSIHPDYPLQKSFMFTYGYGEHQYQVYR